MKYNNKIKDEDVDWNWVKIQHGEKLTLTHIPTNKKVSKELHIRKNELKSVIQDKKRDVYDDLLEELEKLI